MSKNLTVDEQLVPFRGRVPFKQYIPSKPDKYGMKIWWIVENETAYPLKGIPYLGKEGNARAHNLAQNVVEELCRPFHHSNRNITFDNYFTSFQLAQSLLMQGLTSVGTLRKNKTCVPPSFLPHSSRELESNLFGFRNTVSLTSYVPRKNRCVLLLSTKHHTTRTDVNNKNKSEVNLFYNDTKGGVDTLDKLCHTYTVRRKTNRWSMAFFQNIIDVSGVAALVIWNNLYPQWQSNNLNYKRKIFIREIAAGLVKPHILSRSRKGLTTSHLSVIDELFPPSDENCENRPSTSKSVKGRKRCHICPKKIGRMCQQFCHICNRNVCPEHSEKKIKCNQCTK